jgi:hypothetical protein
LKISAVLLKYPTFEGDIIMFSWAKQTQNFTFCIFNVHTK